MARSVAVVSHSPPLESRPLSTERRSPLSICAGRIARSIAENAASDTTRSHTIDTRSCSGLSEHSPLDSFSGSIGMTRRGKYTDVARS